MRQQAGFSLVEAVISVLMITIVISSTVFLTSASGVDPVTNEQRVGAIQYAYEGLDAVYSIRNQRWRNLERTTSTHGLTKSGVSLWQFEGTSDSLGIYTRTITLADVTRNGLDNIDAVGSNDPQTKKVTVNVSWTDARGQAREYSVETYLNNWKSKRWHEDTASDFGDGTHSSTQVTSNQLQLFATLPTSDQNIYLDTFQNSWSGLGSGATRVVEPNTSSTYAGDNSLLIDLASTGDYQFSHAAFDSSAYDDFEFRFNQITPFAFGLYSDQHIGSYDSTVTIINSTYGFPLNLYENNANLLTRWPVLDTGPLASDSNAIIEIGTGNITLAGLDWDTYNNKVAVFLLPAKKTLTVDMNTISSPRTISIITTGKMNVINYNGQHLQARAGGYPVLAAAGQITFATDNNLTLTGLLYSGDKIDSSALSGVKRITLNGGIVTNDLQANKLERFTILYGSSLDAVDPAYFSPRYDATNFKITPLGGGSYTSVNAASYFVPNTGVTSWQKVNVPLSAMGAANDATLTGFKIETVSGDVSTFIVDNVLLSGIVPGNPFSTSGTYTSSAQDSSSADNVLNYVTWVEGNVGGAYNVEVQIRTAATQGGLVSASWCATDCSGSTWLTDPTGSEPLSSTVLDGLNDRWMQYRVRLTGDGSDTPTVSEVKINYSG